MIAHTQSVRPREGNLKEGRNNMATKKHAKPIKGAKKLGNVKPLQRQKFATRSISHTLALKKGPAGLI
jgi:hypothetical protein